MSTAKREVERQLGEGEVKCKCGEPAVEFGMCVPCAEADSDERESIVREEEGVE